MNHPIHPIPRRSASFLSKLFYEATFWATATTTFAFSARTEGMHHIPKTGPVLLIANHQSFLDPFLVGLAARRHLCYLARKTLLRNPVMAWGIRMLNGVPIDQDGIGIEGLRIVSQQLRDGRAVLVFPEGSRTPDGALHPLMPGIHLLIKKLRPPVIPVGIAGAYDAWPIWRGYPLLAPLFLPPTPGTIAISIGPPLDGAVLAASPRKTLLQYLLSQLQTQHDRADKLRRKA